MQGVQNVVNLALSASPGRRPPHVIFLSSISAVLNYKGPEEAIPEVVFDDVSVPLAQGYGQSKYIGERILVKAAEDAGVPVTIVRVGQLSGSTLTGAWNPTEYVPILLQSCKALGQVPTELPVRDFISCLYYMETLTSQAFSQDVRWIPTDTAATVLLNIMLNDAQQPQQPQQPQQQPQQQQQQQPIPGEVLMRHIDSPYVLPGDVLVQWLIEASGNTLQPVAVDTWLQNVKNSASADQVPAKRLLPFYEGWLKPGPSGPLQRMGLDVKLTSKVCGADGLGCGEMTGQLVKQYWDYMSARVHRD